MPARRSNLHLAIAAAAAAVSAALLAVVVISRPPAPEAGPATQQTSRSAATTEDPIPPILEAADTLVRQGEADRAEAVLRSAIAQHPDDQELRLALAGACVLQRKLADAYEQYEAALAIGPSSPETEFHAGSLAAQLDRPERAAEHFAAAQAADATDPRYPLYLAQVQIRLNQPGEARKNLLVATRIDESLAIAWGTLAELSLRDNDPAIALQFVERARQLEPAVTAWRVIQARALNRTGKPAEALAVVGGIPDAERRQLPILKLIGECYGMLGQPEGAMDEFQTAAALNPDNADLLFETAVWCERAGAPERALHFARRAADRGHEAAAKMAARLAAPADG